MTDHPTATDYRNRAERAEQESREAWACADRLAEALELAHAPLLGGNIGTLFVERTVCEALAAYHAERVR